MRVSNRDRVLVTGGPHLCERVLSDRCDALCVDHFYRGIKDNVRHLLNNLHFERMRHNVAFLLYVAVHEIYNLTCQASPILYQLDPVKTAKISLHRAMNILWLAKHTKAEIFQACSSKVYGDLEEFFRINVLEIDHVYQ